MSNESNNLTPARFWILFLYSALGVFFFWRFFNDLQGSPVGDVNALKSAHMISSTCAFIWAILLLRGLIETFKSLTGKSTQWPPPRWFLSFGLLSVIWQYLFIGDLNIRNLFFDNSEFWWLDPSKFYFKENLASICNQINNPPQNCTAEWFATSDIRNRLLVPEYSKAVSRFVALVPAFLILLCAWLFTYKKIERDSGKAAA